MDKIFFVVFLLTGFCVISVSSTLYNYLIKNEMTFFDAYEYCSMNYDGFCTMQSSHINNHQSEHARNDTDKVWVGLIANTWPWTGMDGQPAQYFNWHFDQPDGGINQLCAATAYDGDWHDFNCSLHKQSVCYNGSHYTFTEAEMTWNDAAANCEASNSSLVHIQDATMNEEINSMVNFGKEVWIGLRSFVEWNFPGLGEPVTYLNWREGQPDNLNGNESCAAMMTEDGTWTDEQCDEKFFFYCIKNVPDIPPPTEEQPKEKETRQMVMKLKLQTTANMEDPEVSASLEQQLGAMLAKQGVTDFKLTWKKLPEKETQNERKGAS